MPLKATHTKCPYTLTSLASLAEVNDEHIFPDAIGGVKDYSVRVSAKTNSELGTRIDAPLISSFLIGGMRLQHGIKSRSGKVDWKLRGKLKDSGRDVDLVFPEQGNAEVYIRKPVEMSADGKTGKLVLRPDQRDAFVAEFMANHKLKGRTVIIANESRGKGEAIEVPIIVDTLALKRAMAKIAFLAVYELLGDAFLDDPLVADWHKAFLSASPEDARTARIYGVAFETQDLLNLVLPPLQPYEHAVVVANLQMKGPVVGVTLFGNTFHALIAIASETSNYGLDVGEGKIAICDAKAAKTRFLDFTDHLVNTANRKFGIGIPG